MNQERKGKAVVSRALPVAAVQHEDQQATDEIQAPVEADVLDEPFFEVSAPQQEKSLDGFLTVIPVSQLKFFHAMAAIAQKF